ncbi:hypothetical protein [Bacillus haikouensis]|nr:hypothetical protein [Bacillus haikouensis]
MFKRIGGELGWAGVVGLDRDPDSVWGYLLKSAYIGKSAYILRT